jgi:hypothetical protein
LTVLLVVLEVLAGGRRVVVRARGRLARSLRQEEVTAEAARAHGAHGAAGGGAAALGTEATLAAGQLRAAVCALVFVGHGWTPPWDANRPFTWEAGENLPLVKGRKGELFAFPGDAVEERQKEL